MAAMLEGLVLSPVKKTMDLVWRRVLFMVKTTNLNEDANFLRKELRSIHAALGMLEEMLAGELIHPYGEVWVGLLRELSYDIEDVLDAFMVRREGLRLSNPDCCFMELIKYKIKFKDLTNIKLRIAEVAEIHDKCRSFRFDNVGCRAADTHHVSVSATKDDELLPSTSRQSEGEFVGVDEAMHALISRLIDGDDAEQQLKIVSVVGFGGMGKTTLAKLVYQRLRSEFDCGAYVSLCRNPNMKKVFMDLLLQLQLADVSQAPRDLTSLIDKIKVLHNKRYLIVVDDLWDKKSWEAIKRAVVETRGSRIITTTRNLELAEDIGCVYKLKLLSRFDSQQLFCRRIFDGDEYPSKQLSEVCDDIISKYGGLPLAIITIARLLRRSRSEDATSSTSWCEVYNSLGSGRDLGLELENMRRVLLFSYFDLPFLDIRNCLKCISVFPGDHMIRRERLVCRWIAEGFIQGSNLLEVGQSYFRELKNKGMIEEVDISDGTVNYCRVHPIIVYLIRFLSREQNFVTVLDDGRDSPPSQGKVRRLSLQTSEEVDDKTSQEVATMCMSQVRSVTAFGSGINQMPPLSRFEVLRVMDLEGCHLKKESYSLEHIGRLLHLRYLGLRGTLVPELPKSIGKLRFLQILDVVSTGIKELPSTVVLLQRLICLYVDYKTRLPDRMGVLTSLLELSNFSITESPNVVRELHKLTELTALGIVWDVINEPLEKELLETIGKLNKLQTLNVYGCGESALEHMREGSWVPPPDLRTFVVRNAWFSQLPSWIHRSGSSQLRNAWFSQLPSWIHRSGSSLKLTELRIVVKELRQEDLQALGMLQDLRTLQLAVERTGSGGVLVVDGGGASFPCLRELRLRGEARHYQLVFQEGAGPKVRVVELHVDVDRAKDSLVWGLGSLPSLQDLYVAISMCGDAEGQQGAETALRQAAAAHPNRPTLHIIVSSDQEEDEPENVSNVSSQEIEECSTSMRSARQS